jgi:hypothetical protein
MWRILISAAIVIDLGGAAHAGTASYRTEIAAVDLGANGGSELGGPIDHAIHGNWGRVGISLGAHLATAAVPVLVLEGWANGMGGGASHGDDGVLKLAGFALLLNLAATGLDVALAYGDASPSAPRMVSFGGRF